MTAPKPPREYAASTTVPSDQTRGEIVKLLRAHGATKLAPMSDFERRREVLMFELAGRRIRFTIDFPDPAADEVRIDGRGYQRPAKELPARLAQIERTKWRKLFLLLKGKLEAIRDGSVTTHEEFLAQTVLPNGQTVGEWSAGQVERAYLGGQMPPFLPGGGPALGDGRE